MNKRILFQSNNQNLLYISFTTIDDLFQTNLHTHDNLEILLFTNGEGYIQTSNKKILVKKGSCVLINPNSKHCELSQDLTFYAIGVKKTNLYLKESFKKKIIHFSLNIQDYNSLLSLYEMIFYEGNSKNDNYISITENLLECIFLLIQRYKDITKKENKNESNSELVSNIKNIINNYYYTNIKLNDIAYRLSQSKSTICHEFKKETGTSIIQYKINKQLEEACNLLQITDMSISTISSMVGFNSTAYFSKYFKQKYNKTPKKYKKEMHLQIKHNTDK